MKLVEKLWSTIPWMNNSSCITKQNKTKTLADEKLRLDDDNDAANEQEATVSYVEWNMPKN